MNARRPARALLPLLLVACERSPKVMAPEPTATADVDTLPALPTSIIEAPLSYEITPVVTALERAVPRRFGDLNKRLSHPTNKRVHFAFEAQRDPFVLKLDGDTVRMSAVIHYAGRAWYNPPVAPEMSASCGSSGERPRARIEVVTPIRLTPDWKLHSRARVRAVEALTRTERDQCEVTFLKLDVTGKVIDAARKLLEKNARVVDAKVASLDLRSRFEEWWSVIQQPIQLTDTVWLAINPHAVHLTRPDGSQKTLRAGVILSAHPSIVVGRMPPVSRAPLPTQVDADIGGNGFHILLDGALSYDVASKLLTEQLHGQKIIMGGRSISVDALRVFGVGGGRIALEVLFGGSSSGRVFFVGTPHYDMAGDRLYVPDLDYDVGTANMLVRGFAWLRHDDLRDYLRARARWPMGGLIAQGRAEIMKGLNRELSRGVRLSGDVREVEIAGVHAGADAVHVRAHADGIVRLDVTSQKNAEVQH